jgi:hypothetical protein
MHFTAEGVNTQLVAHFPQEMHFVASSCQTISWFDDLESKLPATPPIPKAKAIRAEL